MGKQPPTFWARENSDAGVALKTPSTSPPSVPASPFRRSADDTGTRGWKSINWLALAGMGNVSAWSGPSSVLLPPNALHLECSTLKAPQRVPTIPPWLHVKMGNSGEMEKKPRKPSTSQKDAKFAAEACGSSPPTRKSGRQSRDVIKLLIYSSVLEKR